MCSMWRTCQPAVYRVPYYILLFQVYTDRQIEIHCGGPANQRCTGCHITFYCSSYTQLDKQIYTVEDLLTRGVQDAILHSTVPGIHSQIDRYTLWRTCSKYTQIDRKIYTVQDMFQVYTARQIDIQCGGPANQRCTGCHITFYCSRYTQIDRKI